MTSSSRLLAFTLLALSAPCLLQYHGWVSKLPHIQLAHASPLSRKDVPKLFERRIVAIGDLHGDYDSTIKILKFSNVIDEAGKWSGKVHFLVQTGDIVDKGTEPPMKLLEYMETLRTQANDKGGTVISLLGNHEWMNAIGDWHDINPLEMNAFEKLKVEDSEWQTALTGAGEKEDEDEGKFSDLQKAIGKRMVMVYKTTSSFVDKWAANYKSAARLPLHHFLGEPNTAYDPEKSPKHGELSHAALSFVHGGLSPMYTEGLKAFPATINEISDTLMQKLQTHHPFPILKGDPRKPADILPADMSKEETGFLDTMNGPLWYRGWANKAVDEEQFCKLADMVLKVIGTRRMIMGHTPQLEGILSRCDGKVLIIDTGISQTQPVPGQGVLSALSIVYTLTPQEPADNPEDQQWEEREVVTALYGGLKDKKGNVLKDKELADDRRLITGNFIGHAPKAP